MTSDTVARSERAAVLPSDPAAFVAEAERISNAAALDELAPIYAPDVVFESTTDGVFDRYAGRDQVVRAWSAILTGMRRSGGEVHKTLLGTTHDAILNDWQGQIAGRLTRGLEYWRFDEGGLVCHHRIYASMSARSSRDPRAVIRLALNWPLLSARMLTAQVRFGAKPQR
ncbi:MAG TPA: hypothetical protein VGW75_04500 [Solirubrobacteraceae bacterium]|nr:hypothetical protein [Solirubrobacteraceae bacterium]